MTRLPLLLALAALIAFAPAGPAPASDSLERRAQGVVAAVNAVRARSGLGALRRSARLDRAAQAQADWVLRTGRLSHLGRGGVTSLQRVRAAGYGACYAAENLAYGPPGADDAARAWLASAGHRRNALSRRAREVGIAVRPDGRGRPVWVMVFGTRCG